MYQRLRLCSDRGGYEAVATPPNPLDLAEVKAILTAAAIPVIDARVMLIASLESEVTISRGGRLLFKTRDARLAEREFGRLRKLLGLPEMEGPPSGVVESG